MFDLTTAEGVLAYLKGTQFAATDVQLLTGGHCAFTYRAKLQTPLPTGETSVIIKHSEGYIAFYQPMKIEAERAAQEYDALVAVSASGFFDSDSIVQVPKPLHFDHETNTVFMTDLGAVDTLTKVLTDSLEGVHSGENADSRLKAACALASAAGSALGDFVARFHNWSSLPEQAALRERFARNLIWNQQAAAIHHDMTIRSATMFGLKEPWLDAIVEEERQAVAKGGDVLAIGDLWLDNVLVSRAPEHGGLRLYVIDWEAAKPAPPEFDIGEITGATASFARRYGVQDIYPFIPALHQAYSRRRSLDPLKIARLAGMDMMGFGTVLPWAREESEEFLKQVTLEGYELLQLSKNHDVDAIKTKSLPDVSPPSPNCVPSWADKCTKIEAALEEWISMRELLANSIKSYLAACATLTLTYAQPPYQSSRESAVERALLTVDSELDSLASEESALRNMRSSLATIRNKSATLARINTLPPEILAQIFALSRTHCIHDNELRFCDLASVCAYWQQIALNTPDLWTHVDVGPRTPISLTKLLLERAKDKQVHLHLHEPELQRLNNRPVPTPDYEVSKTITVLTPHMHRVCTLDLESYSFSRAFICPMLNLWFSHGSTTLPRALSVYRPIGEQLLYPYGGSKNGMLKSRSENAQGVLLSLSTLHLHRVKFDWESGAYRGLVDLRLSLPCHNATISASQLATILAANPAISILKIAHLRVTSPEDWIPPAPVVLDRLKVLNLANLPSSSLRLLLPLINLPSSPDELSVSLPISSDSQKELGIFLAGSQINTLYCLCSDSSGWPAVAKSLPCLDTLILHEFNMCDIPDAENDKPPQSTQYSQISSVVLLSSVVTFTGLERLLAEHGAPHLSLECCSARSETLHDLEAVRAALLELRPDLKFSISDTDSTSRLPCRTMFDH